MIEFTEAFLPDISDIPSLLPNMSAPKVKRLVGRLDDFIQSLLTHPLFSTHELLWEFLISPVIDSEVITQRTSSKVNNLLDTIYDTFQTSLPDEYIEAMSFEFREDLRKLKTLQDAIRSFAIHCRKSAKCRRGKQEC